MTFTGLRLGVMLGVCQDIDIIYTKTLLKYFFHLEWVKFYETFSNIMAGNSRNGLHAVHMWGIKALFSEC